MIVTKFEFKVDGMPRSESMLEGAYFVWDTDLLILESGRNGRSSVVRFGCGYLKSVKFLLAIIRL